MKWASKGTVPYEVPPRNMWVKTRVETRGYNTFVPCGTGNRKRRTVSEVAIMARDGQVLPPVPAPGRNTLCRVVLLIIASAQLPMLYTTNYKQIT